MCTYKFIHTPYFLVIIVTKPQTTTLVMAKTAGFCGPYFGPGLGKPPCLI